MSLRGKKLGLLLSSAPSCPSFQQGLRTAAAAMEEGVTVYLYCIDDAVDGLGEPELQALKADGLIVYACAYGAQRRNIPLGEQATFAGLTVVNDLIASTDRFVSFN